MALRAALGTAPAQPERGETQTSRVAVKYESKTTFDKLDLNKLPPELKDKVIDPRLAFGEKANSTRERAITQSLEKAFDQLLGGDVVEIGNQGPVTLVMHYEVGLTGSLYESVKEDKGYGKKPSPTEGKKFLGIAFFWDFGVKFEGEEQPRFTFQFDSQPAKDIRWTTYSYDRYGVGGYESPTLPYDKMAESAFTDFQHQIAVRFGVEKPTERDRAKATVAAEDDAYDDDEPPAQPKAQVKPAKATAKRRP